MILNKRKWHFLRSCCMGLSALAVGQFSLGPAFAGGAPSPADSNTKTPVKHVIVIIGENRSFDHVFATYVPKHPGESVRNLLSEGIIKLDANKNAVQGPNFQKAHQLAAQDIGSDPFLLSPPMQPFPNNQLPAPLVGGPMVPGPSIFPAREQPFPIRSMRNRPMFTRKKPESG
jgi:phospholipase C